jgi:hypothetical protein
LTTARRELQASTEFFPRDGSHFSKRVAGLPENVFANFSLSRLRLFLLIILKYSGWKNNFKNLLVLIFCADYSGRAV